MRTVAEINQQNEEFLDKIIGESAFNDANEHIPADESDNESTIPESDPADPSVCDLEVVLSCGEELKMSFTSSVMEELMGQSKEIKMMVNQLHAMVEYIYKDDQLDAIENILNDIIGNEDFGLKMEQYTCIEDRKLRMMFMLHDATHIYTSIYQVISEKDLMDAVFKSIYCTPSSILKENEEDENNTAEDNNSESNNSNEAE